MWCNIPNDVMICLYSMWADVCKYLLDLVRHVGSRRSSVEPSRPVPPGCKIIKQLHSSFNGTKIPPVVSNDILSSVVCMDTKTVGSLRRKSWGQRWVEVVQDTLSEPNSEIDWCNWNKIKYTVDYDVVHMLNLPGISWFLSVILFSWKVSAKQNSVHQCLSTRPDLSHAVLIKHIPSLYWEGSTGAMPIYRDGSTPGLAQLTCPASWGRQTLTVCGDLQSYSWILDFV